VEFESNESDAIEAVLESWGAWPLLFDVPALHFRVDSLDRPPAVGEPVFRDCDGVIQLRCNAANHGEFSLQTRRGWLWVSRATLGQRDWFRYHLLEALVLTALDAIFFTPVHAACISPPPTTRPSSGVLLCGDSGAGKTTLAFGAARAGWTLVSEDGVHLAADAGMTAVGGAHTFRLREPARELFPELRSRPASMTSNGKMAIAAEAGAIGMSTAWSTAVAHSVFLSRRPGTANLSELPVDQGLPYFLEWARSPDRVAAESRLRDLLARGCWKLEYDEFPDALRLLEQLP
jgi:hypothetical protein